MYSLEVALLCLSLNVYYEARSEPDIGQMAVALVTINRAKHRKQSICKTVFEPHQFTWTEESFHKDPKENDPLWRKAQRIARQALIAKDFTGKAMWYHREDVKPVWIKNLEYVGKFGKHLFYREKKP